MWLDYTDRKNESIWRDQRGNKPGYSGFGYQNVTQYNLTDNLLLNGETQNCAIINFEKIGYWSDEWCSAR